MNQNLDKARCAGTADARRDMRAKSSGKETKAPDLDHCCDWYPCRMNLSSGYPPSTGTGLGQRVKRVNMRMRRHMDWRRIKMRKCRQDNTANREHPDEKSHLINSPVWRFQ